MNRSAFFPAVDPEASSHLTKKYKAVIIKIMKRQDTLKTFIGQPHKNRDRFHIIKLLAVFSFFLASFIFIFSVPVSSAGDNSTSSMSSNGYCLHAPVYKPEFTFTSLGWFAPAACSILLFFFFRNYFVVSHIHLRYIPNSSGIRAPPFKQ